MASLGSFLGGAATSLQVGQEQRIKRSQIGEQRKTREAKNRRDILQDSRAQAKNLLADIDLGLETLGELRKTSPGPERGGQLASSEQALTESFQAYSSLVRSIGDVPARSFARFSADLKALRATSLTAEQRTAEAATKAGAIAGAEAEATRGIPTRPSGTPLDPQIVRLQDERAQLETSGDAESLRRAKEITDQIGAIGRGRVLPRDRAPSEGTVSSLVGAFEALDALDTLEPFVGESGVLKGFVSQGGAFIGTNPDAITFQVAATRYKKGLTKLAVGTQTDRDLEEMVLPLTPSLNVTPARNLERIKQGRIMAKAIIHDRIAFNKATNTPIPPEILARAASIGINVAQVKEWDGRGDPFDNAAAVAAKIPLEIQNFSEMTAGQLSRVNLGKLTPDELTQWNSAMDELGL